MEPSGNDITIQIFFFTSALFAGVEAVKARGWRAWLFALLGAIFVIAGLAWPYLKEVYPPFSRYIGEIASSPQAWFTLFVLALAVVAITGRRAKNVPALTSGEISPVELPDWLPQVPNEFIQQGIRLDKLQADVVNAQAGLGNFDERLTALTEKLDGFARAMANGSAGQSERLDLVGRQVDDIGRRLQAIESMLEPDREGLLGSLNRTEGDNRFKTVEAKIQGAKDFAQGMSDVVAHSIDQLRQMIESDRRQVQTHYHILVTSLRARDAQAIFREADEIVMTLGKKLIEANDYDHAAWSADHNLWGHSLQRIDSLVGSWIEHHSRFLDVRHDDYEKEARKAPEHIVKDEDRNALRYKQVCIAQERYERARDGIINYFASKASDLPG